MLVIALRIPYIDGLEPNGKIKARYKVLKAKQVLRVLRVLKAKQVLRVLRVLKAKQVLKVLKVLKEKPVPRVLKVLKAHKENHEASPFN